MTVNCARIAVKSSDRIGSSACFRIRAWNLTPAKASTRCLIAVLERTFPAVGGKWSHTCPAAALDKKKRAEYSDDVRGN